MRVFRRVTRAMGAMALLLGCAQLVRAEGVRGYFGFQSLPAELPGTHAERISRVEPGSPAEAAGLRVGDVLLAVNGEMPGDRLTPRQWTEWWGRFRAGDMVELRLQRGAAEESVLVRLTELPAAVAEKQRKYVATAEQCEADTRAARAQAAAEPLEPGTWLLTPQWRAVLVSVKQQPGSTAVLRIVGDPNGTRITLDAVGGAPADLAVSHLPPWIGEAAQTLIAGRSKSYRIFVLEGLQFRVQSLD